VIAADSPRAGLLALRFDLVANIEQILSLVGDERLWWARTRLEYERAVEEIDRALASTPP
jgi:hypothetical protein